MKDTKEKILVTGGAGFIGSHLCEQLLKQGSHITVIDNFDDYYSKDIKIKNIQLFIQNSNCIFLEIDIRNKEAIYEQCIGNYSCIIHLAAKAGVRPSIESPIEYQEVNVMGTQNLLEFARTKGIKQFVFASSSSVYGINQNFPWKENDYVLNPISPYASTKVSGELLGHVYSHLYGIRFIALRFFTVFGPRQRPDLAIYSFTKKIIEGHPIHVFGDGSTKRDYTYVDDIVAGIINASKYSDSIFEVFNLGNNQTITLAEMICCIEAKLEKKAIINRLPQQPGDVPITCANIEKSKSLLHYTPKTNFYDGLDKFIAWYHSLKIELDE